MSTTTLKKAIFGLLLLSPMVGNAATIETKTYDLGVWLPNTSHSAIQRSDDSTDWSNKAGSLFGTTTSRDRIASDTTFTNTWIFELTAPQNNLGSIVVNDYAPNALAQITQFKGVLFATDTNGKEIAGTTEYNFTHLTGATGQELGINFDNVAGGTFTHNLPLVAGHYAIQLSGTTGRDALDYGSYGGNASVTAVPEPEEWAMMLLALPLMGLVARRKKRDDNFNSVSAVVA